MHAVVFCGVQGAGKTTFYTRAFLTTHVRLSLDLLRTRHRESILLHACIAAQQPFVVDNTNPLVKTRARYLQIAKAAGFRTSLYYFETTAQEAIKRNQERRPPQRVPAVAIYATLKRFERPRANEAFDELFGVKIGEDGQFVIDPFTPEPAS
jgi:predicted kinase